MNNELVVLVKKHTDTNKQNQDHKKRLNLN